MTGNIRDRGTKKWTSIMLTEHVKKLKEWELESQLVERPEVNEFELTHISEEIERAHHSKTTIKLTYWRNGFLKDDFGKVIEINVPNKTIVVDDPFSTNKYRFDEIVAVSLIG